MKHGIIKMIEIWVKSVNNGFDDFKQLVDNMQINLYLTDIQTSK